VTYLQGAPALGERVVVSAAKIARKTQLEVRSSQQRVDLLRAPRSRTERGGAIWSNDMFAVGGSSLVRRSVPVGRKLPFPNPSDRSMTWDENPDNWHCIGNGW
jgi:hypothetical protein